MSPLMCLCFMGVDGTDTKLLAESFTGLADFTASVSTFHRTGENIPAFISQGLCRKLSPLVSMFHRTDTKVTVNMAISISM